MVHVSYVSSGLNKSELSTQSLQVGLVGGKCFHYNIALRVLLSGSRRQQSFVDGQRVKRQEVNATTPKPKKHRPSNIFNLISVLVTETREDANRAFNEIGTLFNSQFVNSTGTLTNLILVLRRNLGYSDTGNALPYHCYFSGANSERGKFTEDGDNNDNSLLARQHSTRLQKRKMPRRQPNHSEGVLRSNVQGLVNLFRKEFRVAMKVRPAKEEEETIW
ncbi:hypothetical protein RUM43_012288 [Polyplax serrata]|uniref:Uncharacterized protein n=1 Tax=Polyplax serrata TaxID=468196 RepID=A0AAN8P3M1_POLSC